MYEEKCIARDMVLLEKRWEKTSCQVLMPGFSLPRLREAGGDDEGRGVMGRSHQVGWQGWDDKFCDTFLINRSVRR